jgi:hypothetical protein
MASDLEKAKKRLDDEYGQVRRRFDEIHERFDRVVSCGPEDDIEGALKELEKKVHEVRTGGFFRHGANGFTRARKRYEKAKAAASGPQVQRFGS